MNNIKYLIHVVILYIIQLTILDNIQLHSYVYINIYILAILTLPYNYKKTSVLLLGFLFGLLVDLANNTMGIHAAATTFIAYLRPRLLLMISNRDQMDDIQGAQKVSSFSWFFKYTLLLTTASMWRCSWQKLSLLLIWELLSCALCAALWRRVFSLCFIIS